MSRRWVLTITHHLFFQHNPWGQHSNISRSLCKQCVEARSWGSHGCLQQHRWQEIRRRRCACPLYVSALLFLSLFVYMTFHFYSDYTWARSPIPGLQSMIILESREFLNSQRLDENTMALVINPDEPLGVPRTSMLLKAQWSVVIGEFLLLSFLPLKKPSHCILFFVQHTIFYVPNGCRANTGEFIGCPYS